MKTLQKVPMILVAVEFIPEDYNMEDGKFYYSEKYKTASHVCPCGCGESYPVPIKEGEWMISDTNKLTVGPSFAHRINCKAHYVIQNGYANILSAGIPKDQWHKRHGFDDSQPGE